MTDGTASLDEASGLEGRSALSRDGGARTTGSPGAVQGGGGRLADRWRLRSRDSDGSGGKHGRQVERSKASHFFRTALVPGALLLGLLLVAGTSVLTALNHQPFGEYSRD